ncbi:MAG: CoA transferase [Acidobacteria bacterium]|nr:CoA transferase [Acidobacteriota bacterium]
MPGPLEGVRVVELGLWVAGPAAAGIMADWGADVVKIETPKGDPARTFQAMLGGDMPTNPPFELDNRSKRSIALDLSQPEARAIALELICGADVFVTNLRAMALEDLGLDYASVQESAPETIYAHITGYGTEGPDANRAAYDIAAFWARSGIADLLTPPDGLPPFQRGGMGDHSTGLAAVAGVMAALYHRERTGEAQLVSTSLFRQGVYTVGFDLNIKLLWGLTLGTGMRDSMGNPATNNYLAGDGKRFWIVGLEGARHWPPIARVVGHPEWIDDPRFLTGRDRAQNAIELIALLDEEFAQRPLAEWAELFEQEPDFFWAPVNSPDDLLEDAQFHAAGCLVDVPDNAGTTPMIASPVDFSETEWAPVSVAPRLGEHTGSVLAELGRDDKDIARLIADGVVDLGNSGDDVE